MFKLSLFLIVILSCFNKKVCKKTYVPPSEQSNDQNHFLKNESKIPQEKNLGQFINNLKISFEEIIQGLMSKISPFKNSADKHDIYELFKGVVIGFGDAFSDNFEDCIKDGEIVFKEIQDVIAFLESNDEKKVLEALKKLAQIAQQIPKDIYDCKAAESDFKNLIKAIEALNNPMSFVYHVGKDIIVNRVQIFQDVENMKTFYHQKNYFDFGVSLGNILDKILVGSIELEQNLALVSNIFQNPKEDFFKAFFMAFANDISPSFAECITEDKQLYKQFQDVSQKIQNGSIADKIQAMKEIKDIALEIPSAMRDCSKSVEDLKKIEDLFNSFSSFSDFMKHLGQDFVNNKQNIILDIMKMKKTFQDNDMTQFGHFFGDLVEKLLIGQEFRVNISDMINPQN